MITANEARKQMPTTIAWDNEFKQRMTAIENAIKDAIKTDESSIEIGIKKDSYNLSILLTLGQYGYKTKLTRESVWADGVDLYEVSW